MQKQCKEEQGLLGKLCPGEKKLQGKTFYLDSVKKRSTALLLETISLLGGRIESFLHKDVSFVVSDGKEGLKEQKLSDVKEGAKDTNEETQCSIKQRASVLNNERQRPVTTRPVACGSRGKALLEKAIRNNERLQGSSVLANAQSWGVKILNVNDVLLYLRRLTREGFSIKQKWPENACTKPQGSVIKASALRSPYLKIEDSSRRYKPLHMQSLSFPSLCYSGRFSPFESPPPRFEKRTEELKTREKKKVESRVQNKCENPLSCIPSPWRPHKKDLSYCECCHTHFSNLEEHLQSDHHRSFALDCSNYSVVDQLVVQMLTEFDPDPPHNSEEILNKPPSPLPIQDFCELESLSDVETEHAVQALRKEGSQIYSPSRVPLSFGPPSPSPGVQLAIPNPATSPADIRPSTRCRTSDIQPDTFSPLMPVLDVEPQLHNSACKQPDHLSPCPDISCECSDSYSLAPVLSPQLPTSYIMESHSSYSDPPILSPQQYTAEELVEEDTCEMHTVEHLSETLTAAKIPSSTPLPPSVLVTNSVGVKASNQEDSLLLSGIITTSNLECDRLASCRSQSHPRQSSKALNPKKRCRSASSENGQRKRRRITLGFGYNCRWTKEGRISAKLDNGIMVKPEDSLSLDKTSYQSFPNPQVSTFNTFPVERDPSRPTSSPFCVPPIQYFTLVPHQINTLCHGSTSVADQPSRPLSSTVMSSLLQFTGNKSPSGFSSQDSQRSLSHSASVCIESALIPDLATLSPSSSDSDWDCDLLSGMGTTSTRPLSPTDQSCELDKELLHRPCTWMHDTSYESRLHTVLQPSATAASLCGDNVEPSAFSRTLVQIVKVQH